MGLKEDVEKLKAKSEEQDQGKAKKFRLPFGKKVSKSQRKKNYVTVLLINENSSIDFKKYQIEDQTITHDLIPRLATAGYVLNWKSNPFLILPNWSVEPFSPLEHYNKSLEKGSNTVGYRIILARMKSAVLSSATKMGGAVKWIIGIVLAGIIIYAIMSSGGS